ncbi:hypothetical protein Tco_0086255 [Tanacetum coccineum]
MSPGNMCHRGTSYLIEKYVRPIVSLRIVAGERIPGEHSPAKIPQRQVARERYPQRQVARERNHLLFADSNPRKDVIFDEIVLRSFNWCLARGMGSKFEDEISRLVSSWYFNRIPMKLLSYNPLSNSAPDGERKGIRKNRGPSNRGNHRSSSSKGKFADVDRYHCHKKGHTMKFCDNDSRIMIVADGKERMNRTLVERVRCLLSHAGFPASFWGEALNTASYSKDERSKLDVKGKPCVFLGYGQDELGYSCIPSTKKIVRHTAEILGPAKQILGNRISEIEVPRSCIYLQDQYIEKVLRRFNMYKAKVGELFHGNQDLQKCVAECLQTDARVMWQQRKLQRTIRLKRTEASLAYKEGFVPLGILDFEALEVLFRLP